MKYLTSIILLFNFVGCNIENNSISINAQQRSTESNDQADVGQNENTQDTLSDTSSTSESNSNTDSETNNNSSSEGSNSEETSNSSPLTFTPKGGNVGDEISLNQNLMKLVTVTNSSSAEVSGELTLSGVDALKLELINVNGLIQNGDGLSYTIAANSSAKFMVVRKSDYQDLLNATIQDDNSDVANITSTSLGYNILYWLNPRDISLSNVNDLDSSGDVSDGDTLNTLSDRSGNNFELSKATTSNIATFISSGQNGHPNVDVNAWVGGGNDYTITTSSFFPITSGDDVVFITSLSLDSVTQRQDFKFFNPGYAGSPYWYNDIYGIDVNTYMTAGQKHGIYIAGVSFDANKSLTTNPENIMLFLTNTYAGNSLIDNSSYYVNNTSYGLNLRRAGAYSNGGFSSFIEQGKIIKMRMNAKVYDAMIIYGSEVSEEERINLHCYVALKNDIENESCF